MARIVPAASARHHAAARPAKARRRLACRVVRLEEGGGAGVASLHDGFGQCEHCMTGRDSRGYTQHKPSRLA